MRGLEGKNVRGSLLASLLIAMLPACTPNAAGEAESSGEIVIMAKSEFGKVPPLLLGHNCQWIEGGFGLWDADRGEPRREVLELLKPLRIACLRFPGGSLANEYRWEQGIGPRASRRIGAYNGGKKKSSHVVGTDEFLRLCALLGAEPLLTVNCSTASPEEAARWVAYCNGDASTEGGKRRARNGHPEPYRVRYWELGNELFHEWQPHHVPPETYGKKFGAFRKVMKEADPAIQVGAIAPFIRGEAWDRMLLRGVYQQADFITYHIYAPGGGKSEASPQNREEYARGLFAFPPRIAERLDARTPKLPAGKKPVAVTEFNAFYGKGNPRTGNIRDLKSALYLAELLHTFARKGVFMSNFWTLIGSWYWPLLSDSQKRIPSPAYYAYLLFANHFGSRLVRVHTRAPHFDGPGIGGFPPTKGLSTLYCGATLTAGGERLSLMVVHRGSAQTLPVRIVVEGFPPAAGARAYRLTGPHCDANNDAGKEEVRIEEESFTAGASFSFSLPPWSLTFIELARKEE